MRIISGSHKGRPIRLPKYFTDRPTTDFAKEALFDILTNLYEFDQIRVLDLFAGSGNISYEFLSRGVRNITLVEKNPKYISFIRKQIQNLFPDIRSIAVVRDDAFNFLREHTLNYDIIFADPPFDNPNIQQLPDLVFDNPSVQDNCLFILEHPPKLSFENHKYFIRHKKYGHVNFSFFQKSNQ
jgi:16S rRNA (guanine(966)-N(2))-methyltransferase RsmD